MKTLVTFILLIVATALEAGGDAVIRSGLQAAVIPQKCLLLALGAVMLFGYGTFLTSAPVDSGRLLGIYVVVFFCMAQFIKFVAFKTVPTIPIVVGDLFILVGGGIITAWQI